LVGLGVAILMNVVTIIVNCYGVGLPIQECCKSNISEYYYTDEFVTMQLLELLFVRQEEIAYCVQTVY